MNFVSQSLVRERFPEKSGLRISPTKTICCVERRGRGVVVGGF